MFLALFIILLVVFGSVLYQRMKKPSPHHFVVEVQRFYAPVVRVAGPTTTMIHQTMPRREMHPRMYHGLFQHNRKQAPEFSFHFYDDGEMESIIQKNFPPRVLAAYRRIQPAYGACRSDFARYCILYVFGGLYLDIKSEIRASPFTLWQKHVGAKSPLFLAGHWKHARYHAEKIGNVRGEVMNWVMMSTPHHPALWALIMEMTSRIENGENGCDKGFVLDLTGPIALSRVVLRNEYRHSIILTDDIHKFFKYNSERCGRDDCRTLFYKSTGKKPYDELEENHLPVLSAI